MSLVSLNASIIIPTYGRVAATVQLHEQLHALEPPPRQIIFVFQRNDEWNEFAQHSACAATCSVIISEASAAKARNAGLMKVETEFVAFIDDDCIPINKNWLEEILKPLTAPYIGLVTGPVLGWSTASGRLPFIKRAFLLVPGILEPIGNPESDISAVAQSIAGGNFAGRTQELREVGGFSERFVSPSLYEETEFAIRFKRSLRKAIWFNSRAQVCHNQQRQGGMRALNSVVAPEFIYDQRRILFESLYGEGIGTSFRLFIYRLLRSAFAIVKRARG